MERPFDSATSQHSRKKDPQSFVRLELQPFAERAIICGVDITLSPQHAQSFSLALHELTTNAAKYGALSRRRGKVGISWLLMNQNKNNSLKFRWQESGGPPVVMPTRHGFGTTLIKATFPDVRIDYSVKGLSYEIDVALGDDEHDQVEAPYCPLTTSAFL
jgi:two-component sensor histidine kinase